MKKCLNLIYRKIKKKIVQNNPTQLKKVVDVKPETKEEEIRNQQKKEESNGSKKKHRYLPNSHQ